MPKVCMLVKHHPFLDARIFKKEAKSLLKNGYDVTLIVPRKDGFLWDIDAKPFTDKFKEQTFVHEGVKIVTYEDKRETISEMASNIRSGECMGFNDPLITAGLSEVADVYHAHEFLSLYAGVGIKRTMKATTGKSVKLIYDSHELAPDPLKRINKEKKKLMRAMLNQMIKEVNCVITVSEAIKAWYLALDPLLPVEVIYNSPPLSPNYKSKQYSHDNRLIICYEGFITNEKAEKEKILAITEECNKFIDFQFKILGGERHGESFQVPPSLTDSIKKLGWIDYESIPNVMEDVDIGWIDFDISHSLNRSFALPNKFFSYLNNGVPVLVNKCYQMEKFITTYHCGLVINRVNPTAKDYAEAILFLNKERAKLQQMSDNARKIMEEKYCWEHMENRLIRIYDRLWDEKDKYLL